MKNYSACNICQKRVEHEKGEGKLEEVLLAVNHKAPCGLPCMGGGVSMEDAMSGKVHKKKTCPNCNPTHS